MLRLQQSGEYLPPMLDERENDKRQWKTRWCWCFQGHPFRDAWRMLLRRSTHCPLTDHGISYNMQDRSCWFEFRLSDEKEADSSHQCMVSIISYHCVLLATPTLDPINLPGAIFTKPSALLASMERMTETSTFRRRVRAISRNLAANHCR